MSCDNCECTCLKKGMKIRHKSVVEGVRLGSAEPKYILYISDEWVIYEVYNSNHTHRYGERCLGRGAFDTAFEKDPV